MLYILYTHRCRSGINPRSMIYEVRIGGVTGLGHLSIVFSFLLDMFRGFTPRYTQTATDLFFVQKTTNPVVYTCT